MISSKNIDLLCIGDTTIDLFMEISEATASCDYNTKECYLQLSWAEKIPVEKITRLAAVGNSANVAVGGSRFGLKTALMAHIGNDQDGKDIKEKLSSEGVSTDYLITDFENPTNFHVALNYKAERVILVHHYARDYYFSHVPDFKWLYFSSVAKGHEYLHEFIPHILKLKNGKLAYNPGSYELREGIEAISGILKSCTILFLNKEEANLLLETSLGCQELAPKFHEYGVEIAVITDGPKGSYVSDGNDVFYCDIVDVPVIERTGCGDSYATGFTFSIMQGKSIEEAMVVGTLNASSVLGYIGAQEGLLTQARLDAFSKRFPDFKAQKLSS